MIDVVRVKENEYETKKDKAMYEYNVVHVYIYISNEKKGVMPTVSLVGSRITRLTRSYPLSRKKNKTVYVCMHY